MGRGQPRRDWSLARAKCELEGGCRICNSWPVEAAHIVGRRHDQKPPKGAIKVDPDAIVPLCREHHTAYDSHELDLLPYLKISEQAMAVYQAGGIEPARVRLAPSQYPTKARAA